MGDSPDGLSLRYRLEAQPERSRSSTKTSSPDRAVFGNVVIILETAWLDGDPTLE